jgi:hypothetical protein
MPEVFPDALRCFETAHDPETKIEITSPKNSEKQISESNATQMTAITAQRPKASVPSEQKQT